MEMGEIITVGVAPDGRDFAALAWDPEKVVFDGDAARAIGRLWVRYGDQIIARIAQGGSLPQVASILQAKQSRRAFDVYFCYGKGDRAEVQEIGARLKERGILPWLDEWVVRPGDSWRGQFEEDEARIAALALFAGSDPKAPWADERERQILRNFVRAGKPVIPVLLPNCRQAPELPVMLDGRRWVDFRRETTRPLDNLIWGITGQRTEG